MKSSTNAEGQFMQIWAELRGEERAVLAYLAKRLLDGQRAIGALDLALDARDWRQMGAEEFADAALYAAFEAVRRQIVGGVPSAKDGERYCYNCMYFRDDWCSRHQMKPGSIGMCQDHLRDAKPPTECSHATWARYGLLDIRFQCARCGAWGRLGDGSSESAGILWEEKP